MRNSLFLIAVVLASWALTWALRHYALANSVMDIPNARSSHRIPTPRGGGVAIVVTFLAAVIVLWGAGLLSLSYVLAVGGAGAWIAVVGFMDDHGHIPARWRLLAHFLGAAWAVYWLGGVAPVDLFGVILDLGWLGMFLAVLYLVWLLNLYNFMDGIDGIASIEAISVTAAGALFHYLIGQSASVGVSLALLAAVLGFLIWNFPPAKIFMGDAGSGFLGMVMGVMSLQAGWIEPELFWCWLIMLGVFVVDATLTLLRRLIRGEKVYEAHRSHAYQFASRRFASHRVVTLSVLGINLLWLLPMALLVLNGILSGVGGLIIAYAPLIFLAMYFRAGAAEPSAQV
jgi:Fuc2NAc and GlcNAc transferase